MNRFEITEVRSREVLDCRGLPTVQADVRLASGAFGRADVPAGRSTGSHEAREIRDGGTRFGGYGVLEAVRNVNTEIAKELVGTEAWPQAAVDARLLALDGTPDKARLGANAVLGVSLACARAAADALGLPLYAYLNSTSCVMPVPQVNLINGGRHVSNDLDFQEFIIMPVGAASFIEALQISTEVNLVLGELLLKRFGKSALNTGDEGGYAPPMSDPREALEFLHAACERSGHASAIEYGLDCAATQLLDRETGQYSIAGRRLEASALLELYAELIRDFGIVSIEDPLAEDDFDGFATATSSLGVQIVGDDLFATNSARLRRGIEGGAANALLWKVNQIGTLTEAFEAAELALRNGYSVVVSERSGETEDPIIADLVVALDAGQIKTGAPVRGERTAKYNQLLRIEEDLGSRAHFAGRNYRQPIAPDTTPAVPVS